MATELIEAEATDAKGNNMQAPETNMESQNTETQPKEIEQVKASVTEVQKMDTSVEIETQSEETQLVGSEGEETKSTETHGTSEDEEVESMEIESETEAEDIELTDIETAEPEPGEVEAVESKPGEVEAVEPKPVEVEAAEPKESQTSKVTTRKLPFDPAKIKAAAAAKSKGVKTAGSKPTGVKKTTTSTKPRKPSNKKEPSVDDILSKARKWLVAPTSWMIRNPETGCFGLSNRHHAGERSEITIAHTEDCDCLDVRLLHISQHVEGLVKKKLLARRSRDAFVVATKLRGDLALTIPAALRFPAVKKQVIRRPKGEIEAELEVVNIVEVYNQQQLVEKWKSLEAYKARPIWKDW
ncbi:hypothetical protein F5Y12DRAFT_644270 [Xylaria sp. FL1777]|nr:hypothetical protein F5Y12DRAFT_644270 [Xylaria sp. FL1777]